MPTWLYDLPDWLFGVIVISTWLSIGLAGHSLFHRVVRVPIIEADRQLALIVLAVVAMLNSLLLAFCAVSVWDSSVNVKKTVDEEANTVSRLARDLSILNLPESLFAREQLRHYTRTVIDHEWPAMRAGEQSLRAQDQFDSVFRAVGAISPVSSTEWTLMPQVWSKTNELANLRRARMASSQSVVPPTLWTVIAIGALLTVAPMFVLPRTRFNRFSIGILSVSMGLFFFLVAVMDRPFLGSEGASPRAFEASLKNMARWEGLSKTAKGMDQRERLK